MPSWQADRYSSMWSIWSSSSRARLRRLIQRGDYFCHACHAVVELLDADTAIVQGELRDQEVRVTVESLRQPRPRGGGKPG